MSDKRKEIESMKRESELEYVKNCKKRDEGY
jgi:hypothetical protein